MSIVAADDLGNVVEFSLEAGKAILVTLGLSISTSICARSQACVRIEAGFIKQTTCTYLTLEMS